VENAFVAGWSWARIAEVLGVSKKAVHKKHARRIKEKYPGEPPGRKEKGE
jgi:DNA-directed RNA polymerase specialized sigma24 family protein